MPGKSLILITLFGTVFGPSVFADAQIPNELKDSLLKGYMRSCTLVIKQQLPSASQTGVLAYCACVGGKTFQSVSMSQYNHIASTGQLPPELESKRNAWRSQCSSQLD